ncbi:MAG: hypothetical protein NT111_03230 [Patescibacteria group bacterium]|nr:hypothetical protein [Patescibacteria group bacterium]
MKIQTFKKSIYTASAGTTLLATKVFAADGGQGVANNGAEAIQGNLTGDLEGQIATIVNLLIFSIGMVAVIMLIIGGFRYVFSQGNEKAVTGAKDTILYAIIGLVIAILSFAIVNFVLGGLTTGS